jgi:hypothetical protein
MKRYFIYYGGNTKVKQAVQKANNLLNGEEIYQLIMNKELGYTLSDASGVKIASLIRNFDKMITVNLYKSKWPWSKTRGVFYPSKPYDIFLNMRRLDRSVGSIAASLVHELVHAVDYESKLYSFGHKKNSKESWMEDTAPFYIDNLAEHLITGIPMVDLDDRTANRNIKKVKRKWWNPLTWF